MASFTLAFKRLLEAEGKYSDHPKDRGGETAFGISRKFYPEWEGWKYIDKGDWATAKELAKEHYKKEYWDKLKLSKVKEQEVAEFIFDTCVNLGLAMGVKYLQKALRLSGHPSLEVDGILGPKTLYAVNTADPNRLLTIYRGFRAYHYIRLVEGGYGTEFIYGWLRRIKVPGLTYVEGLI